MLPRGMKKSYDWPLMSIKVPRTYYNLPRIIAVYHILIKLVLRINVLIQTAQISADK